jgi:assimilatory nitrate reductase catalytic subunit
MIRVRPPVSRAVDPAYPLRLNTGRYRDQWHTMTRTGLSPKLSQHRREALLEIHPADATERGVLDGALASISTRQGHSIFRVSVTDAQQKGAIFVPMHWTDTLSSGGRANRLPDQSVDPVSGQPGFKDSAAQVAAVSPEWRAFLVTRDVPIMPDALLYFSKAKVAGGWLTELAGMGAVDVDALLPHGDRMEAMDMRRGMRRMAVRDDEGRLSAALFLTRSGTLPARDWIAEQLENAASDDALQWLAARPRQAGPDKGAIVCVCFNIGVNQICAAIADQNLTNVEAVGKALNAGTNCGSCRPAIARLLSETVKQGVPA